MMVKKYILIFAGVLLVQLLAAQGGATIKASVDKNKILIGEPLRLTLRAHISTGSSLQFPAIDSIDHFEMLEKPKVDTTDEEGGIGIEKIYTITSFDSGRWTIPSFVISAASQSDTIPVDVVFTEFDPTQEYHDIKDILEVTVPKKKFPWWYIAAGVLVIAAIIWFVKRKKRPAAIAPVPKILISPYEEAIGALNELQRTRPDPKQFYSKLTDIFRQYIFRKKGILSLQKTTDDLVLQLKDIGLPKEQFDRLSQSLRLGDFVKFAKYIPSAGDDNNSFNEIKNAISAIENISTPVPPQLKKQ